MDNSKKLRHEVAKLDKKMLAKKLKEKGIPLGTLNQAVNRGRFSLELATAMYDITSIATTFWQAPGVYKTDGEFI